MGAHVGPHVGPHWRLPWRPRVAFMGCRMVAHGAPLWRSQKVLMGASEILIRLPWGFPWDLHTWPVLGLALQELLPLLASAPMGAHVGHMCVCVPIVFLLVFLVPQGPRGLIQCPRDSEAPEAEILLTDPEPRGRNLAYRSGARIGIFIFFCFGRRNWVSRQDFDTQGRNLA